VTEDIRNKKTSSRIPEGSRISEGSAVDKNQNMESLQDKNPAAEEAVHRSFTRNLLGALAVICAIGGGTLWYRIQISGSGYEKIQTEAAAAMTTGKQTGGEQETSASTAVTAAAEANTAMTAAAAAPALAEIPIDFKTLHETCPDAYAWIRIPDTNIDYPVCQMVEGDQLFYLYHRADKVDEFAGSIYSENYNKRDFSDPVTVLYGHDMSNGSMFQNLHFYENRDYFDNNKIVTVYTPDKVLHYRVFAAYNTSDDHLLLNNDNFRDPEVFEAFEKSILAGDFYSGYVNEDAPLDRNSRILTLSTCNAYDDQRFLVQCLLVESEDGVYTPEQAEETEE